ncbi:MAG TPA: radical SAM family heme chaperone HemW [Gaiellales bacterium]
MAAEHLYLHVPFCGHRCGYCDFVTVTGHADLHERYVDALISELAREQPAPRTIFIGGGTPSLLGDDLLARLLASLPRCEELTIECNPETITPSKARVLVEGAVSRVSLGAQSFQPHLLATLERRAAPARVLDAVAVLREAGVSNLNLDLMFGVPGQTPADLEADLDNVLSVRPEHVSYYELEAKPGTRFTHRHGAALAAQSDALERHYETVVKTLRGADYRWYETANFCRDGRRSLHNLGYWEGRDYLGLGVGAVSTRGLVRTRNLASLPRYLEAVEAGRVPPSRTELLTPSERGSERVMLGLRLDRPLALSGLEDVIDPDQLARMRRAGMVDGDDSTISLSERGRYLANDVVSTILR